MNDTDRGGMTIRSLLLMGLIVSLAVPEIAILILGVIRGSVDQTVFTSAVVATALVVLVGVLTVNYFVRRKVQDRLLSLVDVCRNYASGDRAVRATVSGDARLAMRSLSVKLLLHNQKVRPVRAAPVPGGEDRAAPA